MKNSFDSAIPDLQFKNIIHVQTNVASNKHMPIWEDLVITLNWDSSGEDVVRAMKQILFWLGYSEDQINNLIPNCDNCEELNGRQDGHKYNKEALHFGDLSEPIDYTVTCNRSIPLVHEGVK
jgi:hypothetical protein